MFKLGDRRLASVADRRRIRSWWRIPEWTDAAAYPDEGASADRWAWEFLRRNSTFRAEDEEVSRQIKRLPRSERSEAHPLYLRRQDIERKWGIDIFYPTAWLLNWPDGPDEDGQYAFYDFGFDAPCSFISSRLDPVDGPTSTSANGRPAYLIECRPDQRVFVFDLDMPIASQIKRAQSQLERARSERPDVATSLRPRYAKFRRYIRVFDGYHAMLRDGLSAAEAKKRLADYFSSECAASADVDYVQQVENDLKAAERYISDDYRTLPALKA